MANSITISSTVPKFESGDMLLPQRDTDNSTDVSVGGSFTGTLSGLEFSWKGGAFAAVSGASIGASTWTCTLPSLAGDEGSLILRASNDHAATDTTFLALGDNFYDMGDSIGVGAHINNLTGSATPKHNR